MNQEIIGNFECFIIVPEFEFVYSYYSILHNKNENIPEDVRSKKDDDLSEDSFYCMGINNNISEEENEKKEIKEQLKDSKNTNTRQLIKTN